jgi:LPXTG-site transpeptidase (sortase) family protein
MCAEHHTPAVYERRGTLCFGMSQPPFGHELRYIGRDGLTGMPTRVDDVFIAQVEEDIERYGQDARDPVPPPPPGPRDIVSVTIEPLGLSAVTVGRYGLDAYGRLDVPQDTSTIGWNPAFCSVPGEGGATFLAAHVYYAGRPGVFARLSTLKAGNQVIVAVNDGSTHTYSVTSVTDYALGTIDMGALLHGREGFESITLMTCSGQPNEGEFPLRTVVLAVRAS